MIFSFQGIGNVFAGLIVVFAAAVFPLYMAWRVVLLYSVIPSLMSLWMRAVILKKHPAEQGQTLFSGIKMSHVNVEWFKSLMTWNLLYTAGSWFLFDVCFYGNALFLDTILSISGLNHGDTPSEQVINKALLGTYIALGSLPGYAFGFLTIRKFNPHGMQLLGFTMMAFIYGIMALTFYKLKTIPWLFLMCYGATFLFSNWGPNTTTYVNTMLSFHD